MLNTEPNSTPTHPVFARVEPAREQAARTQEVQAARPARTARAVPPGIGRVEPRTARAVQAETRTLPAEPVGAGVIDLTSTLID